MNKSSGIYFTEGIFAKFREVNDVWNKKPLKQPIDLFANQSKYHQVQEFNAWKHYQIYWGLIGTNPWWNQQDRIELYYYFDPILHSRVYVTSDYRLMSAIYNNDWEIRKRIKLIKYPYQAHQPMWKIFDDLKIINSQLAQGLIKHYYYGKKFNIDDFGINSQLDWKLVYQNIVWKYELMHYEYQKQKFLNHFDNRKWFDVLNAKNSISIFHQKLSNLKAQTIELEEIWNNNCYFLDPFDFHPEDVADKINNWWNPYQLFLERAKLLPEKIKNSYQLVAKNDQFYLKINDHHSLMWWWDLFTNMSDPSHQINNVILALNLNS